MIPHNFGSPPAIPFMDRARTRDHDEVVFETSGESHTIDTGLGEITYLFGGASPTWSLDDTLLLNHARGYLAVHDFNTGETEKFYRWGWSADWRRF
jgi:hypothetical protein